MKIKALIINLTQLSDVKNNVEKTNIKVSLKAGYVGKMETSLAACSDTDWQLPLH